MAEDDPIDYEKVYQILEDLRAAVREYKALIAQGPRKAYVVHVPARSGSEGTDDRRYPYVPSDQDRARWIARKELRPFSDLVPPDLPLTGYTGACLGITGVEVGDHSQSCECPKCSIERDLTHEEEFSRFLQLAQALCPRCTPGWNIGTLCPDCIDLFAPAAGCGDDADAITSLWRRKEIGQCAECQGAISGCVDPEHGYDDPVDDGVDVCSACRQSTLGTDAQGAELRALWEAREETS